MVEGPGVRLSKEKLGRAVVGLRVLNVEGPSAARVADALVCRTVLKVTRVRAKGGSLGPGEPLGVGFVASRLVRGGESVCARDERECFLPSESAYTLVLDRWTVWVRSFTYSSARAQRRLGERTSG